MDAGHTKKRLTPERGIALWCIALLFLACGGWPLRKTPILRVKGSDTMLLLTSRWAEEYMELHPDVSVYAEGGGSALGVKALIDGESDICAVSRPLRPDEARLLAEKYSSLGMSHLVAKDALSIYLHPANPVQDLSLESVKKIFSGEITDWKSVGGLNEPIRVLIRSPNSGTFLYFKEHVLDGGSYRRDAVSMATTSAIVQTVSMDRSAIGYGGIAYGSDIGHVRINGVAPTEGNVRNNTYPIIRYLYLCTVDTPRGEIKSFIDWVLKEGQKTVKKVGYIPLWEVP